MGELYQSHTQPRRSANIQCDEGRSYPMLLVRDSMTREMVTLAPDETVGTALALCRERRIRHIPVLKEGRLVGIVSDRDLRSATPAFGDPERAAALQEILVEDVMITDVVSVLPDDPIEQAANTMRERRIGSLPVVENGELVGIITSSDVMSALVYLVGANEPGSRMEIAIPDRPGALAGAAGVFGMCGINIVSAAMGQTREPEGGPRERIVVFRVDTIDTAEAVGYLEEAGYSVLWPLSLERPGCHRPRPGPGELRLRRRPSFQSPTRQARDRTLPSPWAAERLSFRRPRSRDRRGPDDSPYPHLRAYGPEGRTGSGGSF